MRSLTPNHGTQFIDKKILSRVFPFVQVALIQLILQRFPVLGTQDGEGAGRGLSIIITQQDVKSTHQRYTHVSGPIQMHRLGKTCLLSSPSLLHLPLTTGPPNSFVQDRNIILAHTFEYRAPVAPNASELEEEAGKIVKEMSSRYLGLVVVPGVYVEKIELEEFTSQLRRK